MSDQPTRESRNEVFGGQGGPQAAIPRRNVMKDDFGFEIPVESVPLPSAGRCYPSDSPLYGQETVEIRAMTAKDELSMKTPDALLNVLETITLYIR